MSEKLEYFPQLWDYTLPARVSLTTTIFFLSSSKCFGFRTVNQAAFPESRMKILYLSEAMCVCVHVQE